MRSKLLIGSVLAALWAAPAQALPNAVVAGWDFSEYFSSFFSLDGSGTPEDTAASKLRPAQYTSLPIPNPPGDLVRSGVFISNQYGTMYLDGQFGSTDVPVDFDANGGITPLDENLVQGRQVMAPFVRGEFDEAASLALQGQVDTDPNALLLSQGNQDVVFRADVSSLSSPGFTAQGTEWAVNFGAQNFNPGEFNGLSIQVSGDGVNYQTVQTLSLVQIPEEFRIAFGTLVDGESEIFVRFRAIDSQGLPNFGPAPLIDNVAILANVALVPIPEPGTALLLATGFAGLVAAGRRRA